MIYREYQIGSAIPQDKLIHHCCMITRGDLYNGVILTSAVEELTSCQKAKN